MIPTPTPEARCKHHDVRQRATYEWCKSCGKTWHPTRAAVEAATTTPEASGEPLSMADLAKNLEAYVVAMGGMHEDDCPGDDTCECAWAPANDAANAACRYFAARAASLPPAQGGDVAK